MLLFKNYKKKRPEETGEKSIALLNKWNALKQKVANSLQKKSELLSSETKKYTLILFCILFGGSSIAIIIYSVTTETKTAKIVSISKPVHANEDGQSMLQPDSIITKQEYNRILQFEKYLLSLQSDSMGKKKYDSILGSRPQLMDSIAVFEKMYLSQNKK